MLKGQEESTRLLAGCGVVADFTLPGGVHSEMRERISTVVSNAVFYAPPEARFVYASSEMAFGMDWTEPFMQPHRLSRTIYGASKRFGERLAFKLGRRQSRQVYALRLGHVHGEIQNVSRLAMETVKAGPVSIPDCPSDTVFAFTIAEALANIALGKEKPGLYTMVSVPQWSWKELFEHYAARCGIQQLIETHPVPARPRALRRLWTNVAQNSLAFGMRHRELLASYLLYWMPDLELRLIALHRRRQASQQIAELARRKLQQPVTVFVGEIPGNRLRSLSDSRVSMHDPAEQVRQMLSEIVSAQSRG
jgi:hypothetical protein